MQDKASSMVHAGLQVTRAQFLRLLGGAAASTTGGILTLPVRRASAASGRTLTVGISSDIKNSRPTQILA